MVSGRKPGYKHSEETKKKISKALSGRTKSDEHKDHIASSMYDLDGKCARRLKELRTSYPDHEVFFDEHEDELLFALQDIRSEKELNNIQRYIETRDLDQIPESQQAYQYSSSSCYAAENVMIELLDLKRFLMKALPQH